MEEALPDWLLLIKHWLRQRETTGYALPFLVGARSIKNGNESPTLDDARILLNEVFNHPFERYIIQLLFCPNLQCLVFGLYQGSIDFVGEQNIRGKVFRNKETNAYAVLVKQDILDKYGDAPEQLIDNISDDFRDPIVTGNFSRSYDKIWSPLARDEIFRIKDVLGID